VFGRLDAFIRELGSRFRGHARVSLWLPAAVVLTFAIIEKLDAFGLHEAMDARANAVRKDRIDEQRYAVELHEPARVPEPGEAC